MDIEEPGGLLAYLRRMGHVAAGESPSFQVLAGGVSNRTVKVTRASGEAWVLKQALPKLRVAVDWFSSPERIGREALGMRWLAGLLPDGAVPRLLFEDPQEYLLCMQAVPEPHQNWKTMLMAGALLPEHVEQFALVLSAIHSERTAKARAAFSNTSFFESLRLEPYYAYTASRVPEAAAFLNALLSETRALKLSLVHGDYSPKNILVYDGRLVLLDHEVIHFGDPAFDVGFSLTHLLSKAHALAAARNYFADAAQQYWQVYADADGGWAASLESRAVRHALACLLARVDGRSPLEYLDERQRARQRAAVLALLKSPPQTIPALIEEFVTRLDGCPPFRD